MKDQNQSGLAGPSSKPVPLESQAKAVLTRKNYTKDLPLLKEIIGSYEDNNKTILKKVTLYKTIGFILLIAVPVTSTLIAFVVNMETPQPNWLKLGWLKDWLPPLSLCLALLTVLNSILKPAVRFEKSCRIGLDLFHWRCEFLERLEKLDPLDDKSLLNNLTEARSNLKALAKAQIDLALPDQT